MTTHHLASWLLKHSDVPVTVLKPVATRLGVSTNYLGAALFAGQLVYENQETIVKYADRGGVRVGGFLHRRAVERYGEDHALTQHLGENVAALDEAFEGTEEEAVTFAEFYRRLRAVDRDAPRLTPPAELLDADLPDADLPDARLPDDAMPDVDFSDERLPDVDLPDGRLPDVDVSGVLGGATAAVADQRDRLRDLRPDFGDDADDESDPVEIPVRDEN
ncbi:hypothetical protein [Halorussus salinus]|uniref:hypothetical protein n=1 Tax=Halorussus salinus TaxID=1364935 RepID=UPI001092B7D1|nr:hypothetical protein [Halorussus salinus]